MFLGLQTSLSETLTEVFEASQGFKRFPGKQPVRSRENCHHRGTKECEKGPGQGKWGDSGKRNLAPGLLETAAFSPTCAQAAGLARPGP